MKKRAVTAKTFEKWKTDHDRELDTLTWLTYKMADRNHMDSMSCSVYPLQSKDSRDAKFQPSVHRRYAKPTSV